MGIPFFHGRLTYHQGHISHDARGFKIQYKLPNSKDVIGEDVRDFYDTIEEARNSIVEDGIYNKKLKDGSIVRSSITMGAPIICFGDVQKLEYISGTWRR